MTTTDYPHRHIPGFRPLVPGEQWHRTDWTPDMLPDGWRPLLLGEAPEHGDEVLYASWKTQSADERIFPAGAGQCNQRTRRPLPPPPPTFEHDGKTWRSHVPGDPCPVDGGKRVDIIFGNGRDNQMLAKNLLWHDVGLTSIIGYRLADADQPAGEQPEVAALKARVVELEQELTAALTPRPIAEAGKLREGFVRIYGGLYNGAWAFDSYNPAPHFIDIHLPQPTERELYEAELAAFNGDHFAMWKAQKGGVK